MGKTRLIGVITIPLSKNTDTVALEKKVLSRLKDIAGNGKVYVRYDVVDDVKSPPDEIKNDEG